MNYLYINLKIFTNVKNTSVKVGSNLVEVQNLYLL
jgi:hypothetical protein